MGEQTDGNAGAPDGWIHRLPDCYRWVAHTPHHLALWWIVEWSNGSQTRHLVAVLLLGGPDEHGVIRFQKRAAEQQVNEEGRPHWEAQEKGYREHPRDYPAPPTWREVETAFEAFESSREAGILSRLAYPRRKDESADDFYGRIARLYVGYARTNGKPGRSIADALGADKSTVGNWITAARKRGYLPPTSKGKVQA